MGAGATGGLAAAAAARRRRGAAGTGRSATGRGVRGGKRGRRADARDAVRVAARKDLSVLTHPPGTFLIYWIKDPHHNLGCVIQMPPCAPLQVLSPAPPLTVHPCVVPATLDRRPPLPRAADAKRLRGGARRRRAPFPPPAASAASRDACPMPRGRVSPRWVLYPLP